MKNLRIVLVLILVVTSCETSENNYSKTDINTTEFYNYKGESISKAAIIAEWNQRLQKKEDLNVSVQTIEIKHINDEVTKDEKIVLIGHTNKAFTKTATELSAYKNGLKLNEIVLTCSSCEDDNLNIGITNGNWHCKNTGENSNCTKISTLQYD